MEANEVEKHCEELRELIDMGPGHNPVALHKALGVVNTLRATATWDYPLAILTGINEQLGRWFGDRKWRGDEAALHSSLTQDLAKLEAVLDRQTGEG
jgi:hypothetical protein